MDTRERAEKKVNVLEEYLAFFLIIWKVLTPIAFTKTIYFNLLKPGSFFTYHMALT